MTSGMEYFSSEILQHYKFLGESINNLQKNKDMLNWLYAYVHHVKENAPDKNVSVYCWGGSKQHFTMTVTKVTSLKEGIIAEVLSDIEEWINTCKNCKKKPEVHTNEMYNSSGMRYVYNFGDFEFTLDAYIDDNSEQCRRIQIGEEVITVPKYKLECA